MDLTGHMLHDDNGDIDRRPTTTKECYHCDSVMSHGFLACQPSYRLLFLPSLSPSVRPRSSWSGIELRCNMAANNLLSQPSLHLGPACQLVDAGKEIFALIALAAVVPASGAEVKMCQDPSTISARTQAERRRVKSTKD